MVELLVVDFLLLFLLLFELRVLDVGDEAGLLTAVLQVDERVVQVVQLLQDFPDLPDGLGHAPVLGALGEQGLLKGAEHSVLDSALLVLLVRVCHLEYTRLFKRVEFMSDIDDGGVHCILDGA